MRGDAANHVMHDVVQLVLERAGELTVAAGAGPPPPPATADRRLVDIQLIVDHGLGGLHRGKLRRRCRPLSTSYGLPAAPQLAVGPGQQRSSGVKQLPVLAGEK